MAFDLAPVTFLVSCYNTTSRLWFPDEHAACTEHVRVVCRPLLLGGGSSLRNTYVETVCTGRPPASPDASAPARSSLCSCTTGGPPASLPLLLLACFFPNFGNETTQSPIYLLIYNALRMTAVIRSILQTIFLTSVSWFLR